MPRACPSPSSRCQAFFTHARFSVAILRKSIRPQMGRASSPRVRIAYLVLSHRNPEQVLRLVGALKEGPAAEVLVRHDPRFSTLDEGDLDRLGGRSLHDAVEFEWGGWSQLQMLLACLDKARELDPDWLLVLSGQDYPLRPMAAIEKELAHSGSDAMLGHAWELETDRVPGPPADDFFLRYAYR